MMITRDTDTYPVATDVRNAIASEIREQRHLYSHDFVTPARIFDRVADRTPEGWTCDVSALQIIPPPANVRYQFRDRESGNCEYYSTDDVDSTEFFRWADPGEKTYWCGYQVTDTWTGVVKEGSVAVEPIVPNCRDDDEHNWFEVSMRGHGGGVIHTDVCIRCGVYRTTDLWAQDPQTGEQGLTSVSYEEADHESQELADRWYLFGAVEAGKSLSDAYDDLDRDDDHLTTENLAAVGACEHETQRLLGRHLTADGAYIRDVFNALDRLREHPNHDEWAGVAIRAITSEALALA